MDQNEQDKLLKIRQEIELPVKLSELEREKFTKTFEALKEWLDDALAVMLEKNRDEAYRYINLLISHLQMVDADYIAGASQASPVVVPLVEHSEAEEGKSEAPAHKIKSVKVVRPTKEEFEAMVDGMKPGMKVKAIKLLDCMKQYFDPDSEVGIDIICSHCSPEEIVKCIRIEDPSIEDASTVFMKHQLGR